MDGMAPLAESIGCTLPGAVVSSGQTLRFPVEYGLSRGRTLLFMAKILLRRYGDDLSQALRTVRFEAALFCRSELRSPWGINVSGRDFACFHLVTEGECFLRCEVATTPVRLAEGDLVILPTGHSHTVSDRPESQAVHLQVLIESGCLDASWTVRAGGSGALSVLVCGGIENRGKPTS